MLIEFRVANFRSFREMQTFSMIAGSDSVLRENTVASTALKNRRILKSAVVYGANASGKSNLIKALGFVRSFVVSSAQRRPLSEAAQDLIPVQPFLLAKDNLSAPSQFELTFVDGGVRYEYGVSVDSRVIWKEWLIAYPHSAPQTWFERERNQDGEYSWYFGPKLVGEKRRIAEVVRPDVLFLSLAATFGNTQLARVYQWFAEELQVVDIPGTEPLLERYTALRTMHEPAFHARVRQLLAHADLGITDFTAREISIDEHEIAAFPPAFRQVFAGGEYRRIETHLTHRSTGEASEHATFEMDDESLGTQRFFMIVGPILDTLEKGFTLIIDELDASLHPLLVRTLIKLFHDPQLNTKHAQLIFNTHDATLLDQALLRRDQIWFTEKDQVGATRLYSLLEFSPRKEEALQKGYLRGRYGAIPLIDGSNVDLVNDDKVEAPTT